MRTTSLLLSFIFVFIIVSCSSDNETVEQDLKKDLTEEVPAPSISSLSHEYILVGEKLEINGDNFLNSKYETKLFINGIEKIITPSSNNKITIDIEESMGMKKSALYVMIEDKKTDTKNIFIRPKGWFLIEEIKMEILKAFIFDNSDTITILADTDKEDNSYYGKIRRLHTTYDGYQSDTPVIDGGNKYDLDMLSNEIGITTNPVTGYFTTSGFKNSNSFGNFWSEMDELIGEIYITYLDETSSIISNCCGAHIMTKDAGQTYVNSSSENGSNTKFRLKAHGKGSDGYFYELGYTIDPNIDPNTVLRSENGFDNWELVYKEVAPYNFGGKSIFYDNDLVFTIFKNELLKSTDLGQNWTTIRPNVENFFIENRNKWYVLSDNILLKTENGGVDWDIELELPIGSEVNHMHFSEKKKILSGKDLLYIYQE